MKPIYSTIPIVANKGGCAIRTETITLEALDKSQPGELESVDNSLIADLQIYIEKDPVIVERIKNWHAGAIAALLQQDIVINRVEERYFSLQLLFFSAGVSSGHFHQITIDTNRNTLPAPVIFIDSNAGLKIKHGVRADMRNIFKAFELGFCQDYQPFRLDEDKDVYQIYRKDINIRLPGRLFENKDIPIGTGLNTTGSNSPAEDMLPTQAQPIRAPDQLVKIGLMSAEFLNEEQLFTDRPARITLEISDPYTLAIE